MSISGFKNEGGCKAIDGAGIILRAGPRRRPGEVHSEPIAPPLVATRHLGAGVAKLLLDVALVDGLAPALC